MSEENIKRRDVLRKSTAIAMAGFGFAGAPSGASAEEGASRAALEAELTEERVRRDIRQRAPDLLASLRERGVLDGDATVEDLPFDEFHDDWTHLDAAEEAAGIGATVVGDHAPTRHLMLSLNTGKHRVAAYFRPERDEDYAIVEPTSDDSSRFTVGTATPTLLQAMSSSLNCENRYECTTECCGLSGLVQHCKYVEYECTEDTITIPVLGSEVSFCNCNQTGGGCGDNYAPVQCTCDGSCS